MKSKELIRLLQEEDPSGETEVSVGNVDIFSIHTEPAYWDGKLQLLVRDPAKAPYYDVIGGKYVVSGTKIVITPLSITDLLWDDPDAIIDYSELEKNTGLGSSAYRVTDDATRQAGRDVVLQVEMSAFNRWVSKKANEIRPGGATNDYHEDLKYSTDSFFKKYLHVDDPLKELPLKTYVSGGKSYTAHPSISDRRESGWEDRIEVYWRGGWGIKMKDGSGGIAD